MPTSYGNFDPTQPNKLANGAKVNAGLRAYEKVFDLATDSVPAGGTTNPLHAARLPKGAKFKHITVTSTANVSGINITVGTAAAADKYVAAAAGPNATTSVYHVKPAAASDDELTAPEDVLITPSGNWPGTGKVIVTTWVSKR